MMTNEIYLNISQLVCTNYQKCYSKKLIEQSMHLRNSWPFLLYHVFIMIFILYPSIEVQRELKCIAETLVTCGKGILAADESVCTMGKRLQEIGVNNDEELRRQWRQTLFTTDRQVADYISGVILFHETLCQKDDNGKPLTDSLKERCIIPGVKVDTGLVTLYNSEEEVTTQGLDNLGARLAQYKAGGIEFARWRSVFKIGKNTPSHHAITTNSTMIARFASICQSQRICPIIEPEVIPDGDHDIERCQKVTETVLSFVFKALIEHHVFLEGTLLKPNMVTSGLACMNREDPATIANATLTALRRTVPPAVPGIVFSSGGQTEEEATCNLNAINVAEGSKPWKLSFAYGRALQACALRVWAGKRENEKLAQDEFLKRAKANSEASCGNYSGSSSTTSNTTAHSHPPKYSLTSKQGDRRNYHHRTIPPASHGGSSGHTNHLGSSTHSTHHATEEDCCNNRTNRRGSPNAYSKPPPPPPPSAYSPSHHHNKSPSPRFGSATGSPHHRDRYQTSRSNPRYTHAVVGLEPSRYQEMAPEGSRYDPKECSRYSANSTNLDQDFPNNISKTSDAIPDISTDSSTN